jgi:hypothetical protein
VRLKPHLLRAAAMSYNGSSSSNKHQSSKQAFDSQSA